MALERCKGTRDLAPAEMAKFRRIEDIFRETARKWGYREVRTPTLEYLHLFTSVGTLTPGMLRKVYSFLDWDGWSGERVVLRPDGTIPVVRFFIANPAERAKLCYVTNIFRFDESGNKARERWQCGVELFGAGSRVADAELVALALAVLEKLGLECVTLKLSHAGLIRELLAGFKLSREDETGIFEQVMDEDEAALAKLTREQPELGRALGSLLALKGKSAGFLKNFRSLFGRDYPELEAPLGDFINTVSLLEDLGYTCEIDIASGRGFEYYSGVMFQFLAGDTRLGGGGRYDNLVSLVGGPKLPASGLALYIDALMEQLGPESEAEEKAVLLKVAPERLAEGFSTIRHLQAAGYTAEIDCGGKAVSRKGWMLEMKNTDPNFVLSGGGLRGKLELPTLDDVLKKLGKI
ncbi:MAG: histidine--tRNA ligase family protein [Dehalococcoidia bacterium]|jgi:histidyl-tRNA synthetase|nr:MAG: histidine--tRNA ligase family protein [Dehalococcoidia bacterium]